jgi:dTDP-4-dehydrorhamnose reductase
MIGRAASYGVEVVGVSREEVDLEDCAGIRQVIEKAEVDLVVNAAGYTAVDKAESEEELALRINGIAPGVMAQACAARGLPFIHVSTDYVFDGSGEKPWSEDEKPNPINAYGRTKLAGEAGLREGRNCLLRVSWVFSARGQNFVRTVLRLGSERRQLSIVEDQVGRPTYAGDLAEFILATAPRWSGAPAGDPAFGIVHFANEGAVSWKGFAEAILQEAGMDTPVVGIPTSAYPTAAKRPANSVLSTEKLERVFGFKPRHWRAGLAETIEIMRQAAA